MLATKMNIFINTWIKVLHLEHITISRKTNQRLAGKSPLSWFQQATNWRNVIWGCNTYLLFTSNERHNQSWTHQPDYKVTAIFPLCHHQQAIEGLHFTFTEETLKNVCAQSICSNWYAGIGNSAFITARQEGIEFVKESKVLLSNFSTAHL